MSLTTEVPHHQDDDGSTDDHHRFRMTVAAAMLRNTLPQPAHMFVGVYRHMSKAAERAAIVDKTFCLLPDSVEIGIMQARSGAYYPMATESFYAHMRRRNPFGDIDDLIAVFERA